MKHADSKKKLSSEEHEELLGILKTRFEKNLVRHKGIQWDEVAARHAAAGAWGEIAAA